MFAFGKKKKEPIFQEKKEIAIATLQAVKNGTQESEKPPPRSTGQSKH